jgi:hypothetical protein
MSNGLASAVRHKRPVMSDGLRSSVEDNKGLCPTANARTSDIRDVGPTSDR